MPSSPSSAPWRPSRWPVLAVALSAMGAFACVPEAPDEASTPLVVVSIFPLADLTAMVAGEDARVMTLLPPRASIHTWEATPGQIRALSRAQAYITVGGGLDGWMEGLAMDDPSLLRLRVTDGMRLLRNADHDHEAHGDGAGSGDPHVWLDPVLVRDDILPRITEVLLTLLPDRAGALHARSAALADSLTALDGHIRATLAEATQRRFIATHEGWGYFAARYGLSPLGSLYEGPGHEPSARGLARLVDAARAERLGAVLAEPQLARAAATALAGEIGAEVVVVDPLGGADLPGRGRYLDLMRFNANAFAKALTQR